MSYGWLTQSAILPKKSKQIKVDDSGMISLKATILSLKDKHQKQPKRQISIKKNAGIAQRIQKDKLQSNDIKNKDGKDSYKSLLVKQKIYNQLHQKQINHSSFLVDFSANPNEDDPQYKNLREQFYQGKLSDVKRQRQKLHENVQIVGSGQNTLRQRLTWQKQIFQELKGGKTQYRPKVTQSFDKKLTNEQKGALSKFISQQQDEKLRLEQIKKKRLQIQAQRIRKLRHLNVLKQ